MAISLTTALAAAQFAKGVTSLFKPKPPRAQDTAYGQYLQRAAREGAIDVSRAIRGVAGQVGAQAARQKADIRGELAARGLSQSVAGVSALAQPGLQAQRVVGREAGRLETLNEQTRQSARERFAQLVTQQRMARSQAQAQRIEGFTQGALQAAQTFVAGKAQERALAAQQEQTLFERGLATAKLGLQAGELALREEAQVADIEATGRRLTLQEEAQELQAQRQDFQQQMETAKFRFGIEQFGQEKTEFLKKMDLQNRELQERIRATDIQGDIAQGRLTSTEGKAQLKAFQDYNESFTPAYSTVSSAIQDDVADLPVEQQEDITKLATLISLGAQKEGSTIEWQNDALSTINVLIPDQGVKLELQNQLAQAQARGDVNRVRLLLIRTLEEVLGGSTGVTKEGFFSDTNPGQAVLEKIRKRVKEAFEGGN